MLRIEDVFYSYPGQSEALRGLSAAIPDGITLLTGPNAGGKTTLLRMLAGLLEPARGRIADASGAAMPAPELRRRGRMVMQDADMQILGAYVGEDILLGAAASGLGDRFETEARRAAERFGLTDYWHESIEALSYGQKRKLCLVHAMLAEPEVLLLDEPFAGLDYPAARELREFIRENRRSGPAQVVSTHELDPVFDLADWLVVVDAGAVVAEGRPADLRGRLAGWSVRPPGGGWE